MYDLSKIDIGTKLYWRCGRGGRVACGIVKEIHDTEYGTINESIPIKCYVTEVVNTNNVKIYTYQNEIGKNVFFTEKEAIKSKGGVY